MRAGGDCSRSASAHVCRLHVRFPGHGNTGDCFVAVTIFPGKVIFVLLGAAEENIEC